MRSFTMNVSVVLVLAISSGSTLVSAAAQQEEGRRPKIRFSEMEFNFGEVDQGQQATHVFEIYNDGNERLKIESVKTSCGCTAAVTSKKELQSGESVKSRFSY